MTRSPLLEKRIERAVCAHAKGKGYMTVKLIAGQGLPDRMIIGNGRVIFIEFKAPGGRVSKLQELMIGKIRSCGVDVYVVDSIDVGKSVINSMG